MKGAKRATHGQRNPPSTVTLLGCRYEQWRNVCETDRSHSKAYREAERVKLQEDEAKLLTSCSQVVTSAQVHLECASERGWLRKR